jgi:antibiotic biosynthesis monooxygenase (ABM) superfamily enzyme
MSQSEGTAPVSNVQHVPPPGKHQLALMIWIAVFPTLTGLNLLFGDLLAPLPMIVKTLVLVTVAVPIVIYGAMPQLHRIRHVLIGASRRRTADRLTVDELHHQKGRAF